MANQREHQRTAASYNRDVSGSPISNKSFLIVTEGEKTEPQYFKALRNRLRLGATDVHVVHPPATDPLSLTRHAIQLKEDREKESNRGIRIRYDEVWVVFDWETVHNERHVLARRAIQLGKNNGIRFADSKPCFESWLLLHSEETTRPFENCGQVLKQLRNHWKSYKKADKFPGDVFELTRDAVSRSQRCRTHHEQCGSDGYPSTNIDLLVEMLNAATRKHFQLFS